MAKNHSKPTLDGTKMNADEVKYVANRTGSTSTNIYRPQVPAALTASVWTTGTDPSQAKWDDSKVSQNVRDKVSAWLAAKGGKR